MLPFVISGQLHPGEIYPQRSRLKYCWHLFYQKFRCTVVDRCFMLDSVKQTNESTKLLCALILSQASALLTDEALNERTASRPAESNRNPLISGLKL